MEFENTKGYKYLMYNSDCLAAVGIIKEWHSQRPDNEKLLQLSKAIFSIMDFTESLKRESENYEHNLDLKEMQILDLRKKIQEMEEDIRLLEMNNTFVP